MYLRSLTIIFGFTLWMSLRIVSAQAQCGYVDALEFPVDPNVFTITQDFGAQSGRFQGRYHTGEDWFTDRNIVGDSGRGTAYGEYVRAIANGRVMLSSPSGWGADGGVLVIEHTFPDNTIAYSMYGHITEETGVTFPTVYTCVRRGDILAAVDDARPTPHLHFEIRADNNTTAGAGYIWLDPQAAGYRRPSKFSRNWQVWLNDAVEWRLDLADESAPAAPPVQLDDYSLIYLDDDGATDRLLRATPDGRVLWRILLDTDGVGVAPASDDSVTLFYSDGEVQQILRDGTAGERWMLGEAINSPPISAFGLLLFHTPQNTLIAYDPSSRLIVWRLENVAMPLRHVETAGALALMTAATDGETELLLVAPDGSLVDRAYLQEAGALTTSADGSVIAYTAGGLWRIDGEGNWSLLGDVPAGGANAAVAIAQDRGADSLYYLFDGSTLYAYRAGDNTGLWQAPLNETIEGMNTLSLVNDVLLLTSSRGDVIAWQADTGAECARLRLWGDWRTNEWHSLDQDGTLRLWVGDQIIGLDWNVLTEDC